jgi:hypothetical protein
VHIENKRAFFQFNPICDNTNKNYISQIILDIRNLLKAAAMTSLLQKEANNMAFWIKLGKLFPDLQ